MNLNLISMFDFLSLVIILIGFLHYIIRIKKSISRSVHLFLILFLVAILFHHFSNFLEWGFSISFLDFLEDYVEIFIPFGLFLFLYSFNQDTIKNKLEQQQKELLNAYNLSEFYRDLFTHDINNVLQGILTTCDLSKLYLEANDIDQLKELQILIHEQMSKGTLLISNVNQLSTLDKIKISSEIIELEPVLQRIIQETKEQFPSKSIEIDIDGLDSKISIKGNEFLPIIVRNILVNSITHNKHSKIEVSIIISILTKDNKVKIEFKDNGLGIENSQKRILLQANPLIPNMKERFGLGILLIKKILEKIDGEIQIQDKIPGDPSKGSNFIILLEKF